MSGEKFSFNIDEVGSEFKALQYLLAQRNAATLTIKSREMENATVLSLGANPSFGSKCELKIARRKCQKTNFLH